MKQRDIPSLARQVGRDQKRPQVRLPYDRFNGFWLRGNRRRRPTWNDERDCWEIPAAWFDDTVMRCVKKHGSAYVIQPYRAKETCAYACRHAKGFECQCSCMGENHGSEGANAGWLDIGEAFSVRYGPKEIACRLITATGDRPL